MLHRMGAGHLRRSLEVISAGQGPPTPAELVAAGPLVPTRELVLQRVLAIAEDLQSRRAKVDGDALAARLSDSERAAWADLAKLLGFGTPTPAVAVQVNHHAAAVTGAPDYTRLLAPLHDWRRAYPEAHEALMEALAAEARRAGA
jgi:hypothetical protein